MKRGLIFFHLLNRNSIGGKRCHIEPLAVGIGAIRKRKVVGIVSEKTVVNLTGESNQLLLLWHVRNSYYWKPFILISSAY